LHICKADSRVFQELSPVVIGHSVVWQTGTDVSNNPVPSVFRAEY